MLGLASRNKRLPGQYYDQETGLHYNYFRYYDPETGRYITSDPIGLEGGLNTYAYVENNPLRWIDPSGFSKLDKWWGLPKEFRRWYHRQYKRKGDPDIPDRETAKELHEEWENMGRPGPDNKGKYKDRGFADPDLLEWFIPWWLTPSDIYAHPCELPGGPPCGPEDMGQSNDCNQ